MKKYSKYFEQLIESSQHVTKGKRERIVPKPERSVKLTGHSFYRYSDLWRFFSVKASAACPPPQEFFELWAKFTVDFLLLWRKEQQLIAKEIYEETKRKVYKEKVEGIAVKPATVTGLKLKLASSRKANAN